MLQQRNKFQTAAGTTMNFHFPDGQFSSGSAYAMLKRRSSCVGSWCMAIGKAQSEDRTGTFGGCSKVTCKSSRRLFRCAQVYQTALYSCAGFWYSFTLTPPPESSLSSCESG